MLSINYFKGSFFLKFKLFLSMFNMVKLKFSFTLPTTIKHISYNPTLPSIVKLFKEKYNP